MLMKGDSVANSAISTGVPSLAAHAGASAHVLSAAGHPSVNRMTVPMRDFLTFRLADADYGIEIDSVLEIRNWEAPTPLADAPAFVKGVINLRGRIVPIVDLRQRLRLAAVGYDAATAVVIVTLDGNMLGLVVDAIADVLSLRDEQILPAPAYTAALRTEHIAGLGTRGDRMVILIALARLLSGDGAVTAQARLS
jgi:purine-binding chemotaxis protein CheW